MSGDESGHGSESAPQGFAWLDEQNPFDPQESAQQVAALLDLLGRSPRRVLDLGCGAGRVLVPLVEAGHVVIGMDRDAGALESCRRRLAQGAAGAERAAKMGDGGGRVRLVTADFLEPWPEDLGRFDAVCCLGNTMMTVADVDAAVRLLERAASVLEPEGMFVMDDCPARYWPELTEGRWQSGLSEDGSAQMVWAPDDSVFALRWGDNVDEQSWVPGPADRRLRLWSLGALNLAGRLAGLSAAQRPMGEGLLIMRVAGR